MPVSMVIVLGLMVTVLGSMVTVLGSMVTMLALIRSMLLAFETKKQLIYVKLIPYSNFAW